MSKQGKEEYGKCEDKIRKVPRLEDRKMGWMDGENEEGNGLVGIVLAMTIV